MDDKQKSSIETEIERAREGVSQHIDELDRKLRTQLDVKSLAGEHAEQLMAGGAVIGFLVGFGFPKILKRAIQIGVPLALVAYKVRQSLNSSDSGYAEI